MSRENTHFGFAVGMFVVVGVLILVVMSVLKPVIKGSKVADNSAEAVVARIAPVAKLNTGAPIVPEVAAAPAAPAAGGARSGKDVYQAACFACHGTGAAGAPVLGDKAAWGARIEQGMDTLVSHAINGINAMPPRGTCGACSDAELIGAIEYMVGESQ